MKAEEEEKKNITEVKLNLLIIKIDETIQKIIMKDEFFVQNHHEEIEEVDSHEQIPLNSNYHRSENEFTDQYEEEESTDLMCMFDDIPFLMICLSMIIMMIVMFSKLKLTLQSNQKLVWRMNKCSFSRLKIVIN